MPPSPPDPRVAGPLDDMDMAIDLDDLGLRPDQRAALARIVADERRITDPAEQRLEQLSDQLRDTLTAGSPDNRTIDNLVDRISAEESTIRKAQLRAWAASRRVLDDGQRQQVEDAARDRRRGRRGR
jgi:Spy/CpxP family protein refolding chaperone